MQKKLHSALRELAIMNEKGIKVQSPPNHKLGGVERYGDFFITTGQKLNVDIYVYPEAGESMSDDVLRREEKRLAQLPGAEVLGSGKTPVYGVISVVLPVDQLLPAAKSTHVRSINPVAPISGSGELFAKKISDDEKGLCAEISQGKGVVTSEAETALNVIGMRRFFPSIRGEGIRIGVLSDSASRVDGVPGGAKGIAESQASGDLPGGNRVYILDETYIPLARDEGRAMMELIYDLAPDIDQLVYATAITGQGNFAENISDLADLGMDVITDDIFYPNEPIYQDGVIAQAVSDFSASGGIYIGSAGNSGTLARRDLWLDSNHNGYHEWNNDGDEGLAITLQPGVQGFMLLNFRAPIGEANTDLDLQIWNENLTKRLKRTLKNNRISGDSNDFMIFSNNGDQEMKLNILVRYDPHLGDSDPTGIVFDVGSVARAGVSFDEFPEKFAGNMSPHVGTNKGIAAAAAPYWTPTVPESFSSRGPFTQYYRPNGTPLVQTFLKPDLMASDGTNNSFFGSDINDPDDFPNFFGTSAASPHLAAIAALVLEAAGGSGSMNVSQFREHMALTAETNISTFGHQTDIGFGSVNMLGAALGLQGPGPVDQVVYTGMNGYAQATVTLDSCTDQKILEFATDKSGPAFIYLTDNTELDESDASDPAFILYKGDNRKLADADYDSASNDDAIIQFNAKGGEPLAVQVFSESFFNGTDECKVFMLGPKLYPTNLPFNISGLAIANASLATRTDIDYYRVTIPPEAVDISFNDIEVIVNPSGFDPVVLLLDDGGFIQEVRDNAGFNDDEEFSFSGSIGDKFYFGVASKDYQQKGKYSIVADLSTVPGQPFPVFSPLPKKIDYVIKPNPVTGVYTRLNSPKPEGFAFHGVYVGKHDVDELRIEDFSVGDNLDLISHGVYDQSGNALFRSGESSGVGSQFLDPEKAQYLIRIFMADDKAVPQPEHFPGIRVRSRYEEMPPAGFSGFPVKLSNNSGGAGGNAGASIENDLPFIGQQNHYKLTIPAVGTGNGTIALSTSPGSQLNAKLELYDSVGNLVLSVDDDDSTGNETLTLERLTPEEEYYLVVSGSKDEDIDLDDPTQTGSFVLDFDLELTSPMDDSGPVPTPTPTPNPALTPVPTPVPTPLPDCGEESIAFSFEEPETGSPEFLGGAHHGDILLFSLESFEAPALLVTHDELVSIFDPRDSLSTETLLTNVGVDAFDLISFSTSEATSDTLPLRVVWSPEIDFVTGENSPLGEGIEIHHGDLLTNTGSIWKNDLILSPFMPLEESTSQPIETDIGLDAIEVRLSPDEFDSIDSGLQEGITFEYFFSFEEAAAGGVDSFSIGADASTFGTIVTHGDILGSELAQLVRVQSQLNSVFNESMDQHGLDAIALGDMEFNETGTVLNSTSWLYSVSETETLAVVGHGAVLLEGSGIIRSNNQITNQGAAEYGLDGLDIVCSSPAPVPLPTPVPLPVIPPETLPPPVIYDQPETVCEAAGIIFSFSDAPTTGITPANATNGDLLIINPFNAGSSSILATQQEIASIFDPRDLNTGEPLLNVGLDAVDVISASLPSGQATELRLFWSSEITFKTGPNSILGEDILIQHGDLLTNTGTIIRNESFTNPFDPKDEIGMPIVNDDFGLDSILVAATAEEFDLLPVGITPLPAFPIYFSIAPSSEGGLDQFYIGSGNQLDSLVTHGSLLSLPEGELYRTNEDLVADFSSETATLEQGLDAIDLPSYDERIQTGNIALGSGGWLISVALGETLEWATSADIIEEQSNVVITGIQLDNTIDVNALDVVCIDQLGTDYFIIY